MRIYKVEKQVDLNSDYNDDYVECATGDYALDGMWRVDHVDQDEDMSFVNLMTSTDVLKAERDAVLVNRYNFSFVKNSLGRAQLKIWVTCIGKNTEQDSSHTHPIVVSVPAFGGNSLATVPLGIDNADFSFDTSAAGCPSGFVAVAPGWHVARHGGGDVADQWGRVTGSTLFGAPNPSGSANRTAWKWRFHVNSNAADPVDIYVSHYCLQIKVGPASSGTSKHKLTIKRNKDYTANLPANSITERSIICGDHYKAMVAGWWPADWTTTWFMGMDPRIKSRAFRFLNSDPALIKTVDLAALCFNYRTT